MTMTPEQWRTIRHFPPHELGRPDAMDYEFMMYANDVREYCGFPLIVTSDARTLGEEVNQTVHAVPPESGLHVFVPVQGIWCRAFDLRWIDDPAKRDRFVEAVYKCRNGRPTELEFVPFGTNKHIHLGLFRAATHSSRLIFSAT